MTVPKLPCEKFPEAKTVEVPLPFGATLKSLVDISQGPPTDCSLAHSLMLQLSPMLAGMTCIIKLLKVAKVLLDLLPKPEDLLNPPVAAGETLVKVVDELVPALADLSQCFLLFDPCKLAQMISAILQLIISYIGCLVEAFESIWNLKAGIDLDAAQGNPVLLASLTCANDNADSAMTSLTEALEGITPILELITPLMEIVGLPPVTDIPTSASIPSLADLADGQDPLQPIKEFLDVLREIKKTVDAIC